MAQFQHRGIEKASLSRFVNCAQALTHYDCREWQAQFPESVSIHVYPKGHKPAGEFLWRRLAQAAAAESR